MSGPALLTVLPDPKRDSYGRYKLVSPEDGKVKSWTRATTVAGTLDDTYNLSRWSQRIVAQGVASSSSIRAKLAAAGDDKALIQAATDQALERGGGKESAENGTAMHTMTERLDRGMGTVEDFPREYQGDLRAYQQGLAAHGITILPEYIERVVLSITLGVAGTFDRIVMWRGQPTVADLKTGSDVTYSHLQHSIQQSIYANASHIWEGGADYSPMPADVRKDVALILHLPFGAATFEVYELDITQGYEFAKVALQVREVRKVGKKLGSLVEPEALVCICGPDDPEATDPNARFKSTCLLPDHAVFAAFAGD